MLKQLSGMDSMFLFAESHRAPLELGCLQIYDPSTSPNGEVRFKEILALVQDRLDRCDLFRQKLAEVPLSLDHPYWTRDDDFDLEYHVRHISLPKPGDWRQLMAQIARLQARQLDHSKPLWMAHIIEGLDNIKGVKPGCFAMYLKVHHAGIDGVTSQELQTALHDLEPHQPDSATYEPSSGPGEDTSPSAWSLLARVPLNTMIKSARLGYGLLSSLPGLVRAGIAARDSDDPGVPMTVFNDGRVSPNRVIDGRFFDLGDFKAIRASQPGTTINDAALAVLGGALRRYLDSKDALPDATLVAGCPVNVGTQEDADEGRGNLLTLMMPPLHTEIDDPVKRLRAIHEGTKEAKALVERLGSSTLTDIPMNLPAPLAKGLYPLASELALRRKVLPYNTMITNVVGIQRPIYLAGAQLVALLGTGPVIDQSGIFHTVFSYNGMMSLGFTACRDMLPDPEFYAECIDASFQDLKAATVGRKPARPTPKKTASKKQSVKKKPAKKNSAKKKSASTKAPGKMSATRKAS